MSCTFVDEKMGDSGMFGNTPANVHDRFLRSFHILVKNKE